jgi:hypothetical protein
MYYAFELRKTHQYSICKYYLLLYMYGENTYCIITESMDRVRGLFPELINMNLHKWSQHLPCHRPVREKLDILRERVQILMSTILQPVHYQLPIETQNSIYCEYRDKPCSLVFTGLEFRLAFAVCI